MLTLAVAQPECVPLDVAANAQAHALAVREAGARVVVFPEMSLTGYELHGPALRVDDPRLSPLVKACAETGTVALAGAPVEDETGFVYITVLAIDDGGARVAYRKMYPGGAEPAWFAPGNRPAVLDVDGWRLGLAVCRDTRFPEHAAATAELGMDVYAAGVLEHAHETHHIEERTRRVIKDHGVWVAVASFAGSTGGGYTSAAGRSWICAPDGSVRAQAGFEPGAVVRATLS